MEDGTGEPPAESAPGGRGRPALDAIAWDPVRAWRFIRASKACRTEWRRRMPAPGLPEAGPFPVRLQTAVDLSALAWGLHAWEDPYGEGPASPFFAGPAMSEGVVTMEAPLSGLRLGDGSLLLKIERCGAAARFRPGAVCG